MFGCGGWIFWEPGEGVPYTIFSIFFDKFENLKKKKLINFLGGKLGQKLVGGQWVHYINFVCFIWFFENLKETNNFFGRGEFLTPNFSLCFIRLLWKFKILI